MTGQPNERKFHGTVRRIRDLGEVLFALIFLLSPLHLLLDIAGTMGRGMLRSIEHGEQVPVMADPPPIATPVHIEGRLLCDGVRPASTDGADIQIWQVHPTVGRARRLDVDMEGAFETTVDASDGPALIRVVMPSRSAALLHLRQDMGRWHSIRVLAERAPPS